MTHVMSRAEAIRTEYAKVPESSEKIIESDELTSGFLSKVNKLLPSSQHLSATELRHMLSNLRKRGEQNGGLVRKQRQFNGRTVKPR